MPASETIKYRILADIATALALPDGDSSGSAYFFQINTNQVLTGAATPSDIASANKPCLVVTDGGTSVANDLVAGGDVYAVEDMRVVIEGYLGDQNLQTMRRNLLRLEHDIRTALMVDPQRNSLAHYTIWRETTPSDPIDLEPVIVVVMSVQYQTKETDLTATI